MVRFYRNSALGAQVGDVVPATLKVQVEPLESSCDCSIWETWCIRHHSPEFAWHNDEQCTEPVACVAGAAAMLGRARPNTTRGYIGASEGASQYGNAAAVSCDGAWQARPGVRAAATSRARRPPWCPRPQRCARSRARATCCARTRNLSSQPNLTIYKRVVWVKQIECDG